MTCWQCDPPEPTPYCARCRTDCTREQPCTCCIETAWGRPGHHRLPEEVLAAYEQRIPGARDAAALDLRAGYARAMLVHVLAIAEDAMTNEDVPPRARHRILNALAYAASTPPDVISREQEARATATLPKLSMRPSPFPFTEPAALKAPKLPEHGDG